MSDNTTSRAKRTRCHHRRLGNVAVPTIHEYVGLPINELFACGLLCEFRPGLVAETYPVKEPITAKRQSSTHTFLVRYPDKIVRMDAEVHVSIIPWKVSREQLREIALEVCREHEPLCEDAHDEGTPEFYDILCSVERRPSEALPRKRCVRRVR